MAVCGDVLHSGPPETETQRLHSKKSIEQKTRIYIRMSQQCKQNIKVLYYVEKMKPVFSNN